MRKCMVTVLLNIICVHALAVKAWANDAYALSNEGDYTILNEQLQNVIGSGNLWNDLKIKASEKKQADRIGQIEKYDLVYNRENSKNGTVTFSLEDAHITDSSKERGTITIRRSDRSLIGINTPLDGQPASHCMLPDGSASYDDASGWTNSSHTDSNTVPTIYENLFTQGLLLRPICRNGVTLLQKGKSLRSYVVATGQMRPTIADQLNDRYDFTALTPDGRTIVWGESKRTNDRRRVVTGNLAFYDAETGTLLGRIQLPSQEIEKRSSASYSDPMIFGDMAYVLLESLGKRRSPDTLPSKSVLRVDSHLHESQKILFVIDPRKGQLIEQYALPIRPIYVYW